MTNTNPDPAKDSLIKIWNRVTGNDKLPEGAQGKLGVTEAIISPALLASCWGIFALIGSAPVIPIVATAFTTTILSVIGTRWVNANVESSPSLKKVWDKISGRKFYTLESGFVVGGLIKGMEATAAGASIASSTAYGVLAGGLTIGVPAMLAVALLSKRYKFFRAEPTEDEKPEAPKPSI